MQIDPKRLVLSRLTTASPSTTCNPTRGEIITVQNHSFTACKEDGILQILKTSLQVWFGLTLAPKSLTGLDILITQITLGLMILVTEPYRPPALLRISSHSPLPSMVIEHAQIPHQSTSRGTANRSTEQIRASDTGTHTPRGMSGSLTCNTLSLRSSAQSPA